LKINFRLLVPLVAAVALVVLGGWIALRSFTQTALAAEARQQVHLVIKSTSQLQDRLTDAETGQRGFALTGNETFLQPYQAVNERIVDDLQRLRSQLRIAASLQHLDALAPLIDAKLTEMARVIALRRSNDVNAVLALVGNGEGKRLMDAIRAEIGTIVALEEGELLRSDATFQSKLQYLLAVMVGTSLFALVFALAFAWLLYQNAGHRLRDLVHLETQHLLEVQEQTNSQLNQANNTLRVREEHLAVTLNSIGDAVLATDANTCVTSLNPVAEHLTGWTQAQAVGRPVSEVFEIINKTTRAPASIPVMDALAHGTIQGLANHTVLIARDGGERDIADSCAPIRDRDGQIVGAVLVFRDVTAEYAVQQALRDSSVLVQTVLNTVVDGIITIHASDGIIETANPAIERMFGYAAAELRGQHISHLIPEFEPSQREESFEMILANIATLSGSLGREVVGRHHDASHFNLEISAGEMWLGGQRYFTAILRDLTSRKQVEQALLKAGALQSAIFNSANFSSIATDAKGVIQIFNVGAERMLGYAAADVLNRISPADISDPQEVIARAAALSVELGTPITPGFEALVFKASRGIEDIYELTYIRKDGSRFPAVVSVTALRDDQNTIIGYLLIGTDNTARKLVEEERSRITLELEKAKAVAEKANLAKSDFLSSMSHELRSPLNAILGFAQLMDSDTPPPTHSQKANIGQILHAGWYLLELINEILDLAVIESGRLSLSLEPVSLPDVMIECQAMIEPQARTRGISMTFPQFDGCCYIKADHTRVKQVLINLLSNAIKYNQTGGSVTVTCEATALGGIRISVKDSGAGLSPENLAQLFQPFNRLGQESGGEEGTGIGLVVSKRLVELMQGTIGVESTVGGGSVFWIELRVENDPHAGYIKSSFDRSPLSPTTAGIRSNLLLYVEDNPANLNLIEQLITRRPDMRLLTAQNGIDGINLARASMPDVILMDINLPGINGIEAMKILRLDPLTAHIPIVALSANAMPRDIEKGLAAGFFRYLTKPIKVDQFMTTLNEVLEVAKTGNDNV
jgi:PAS domain S-box-containing protein